MTDTERIAAGIALSLFVHFALLTGHWRFERLPGPPSAVEVRLDMESVAAGPAVKRGIRLGSPSPQAQEEARIADLRRKAFLRFLQDVDDAVHAGRLQEGASGLIGAAEVGFTIFKDGTFRNIRLISTSGRPRLDAFALRAVRAASGKIRRPAIIGYEPIPVNLQVKYQYGLR
jgi:TonB family protein